MWYIQPFLTVASRIRIIMYIYARYNVFIFAYTHEYTYKLNIQIGILYEL